MMLYNFRETKHIEQQETASAATDSKPVERVVEARTADDSMSSMVRCLYFADTFVVTGKSNTYPFYIGCKKLNISTILIVWWIYTKEL